MLPRKIRVSVKLEKEADPEQFPDCLEQALGRREEPLQQVRAARVLVFLLNEGELPLVRSLPGVLRAEPERRCELPPPPRRLL